jgi:hypothetical protein
MHGRTTIKKKPEHVLCILGITAQQHGLALSETTQLTLEARVSQRTDID